MAKKNNNEVSATLPATIEIETSPVVLVQQALQNGASVEVMEKLLALQERFEANNARKRFDAAMADLRVKLPKVVKSERASGKDGYGYKYEELSEIVALLTPVLGEHGISFRWRTDSTPSTVKVTCIVSHRDGHMEETSLSANTDTTGGKNAIQALGSAVTYLQRYTLKAALGIAAGADDDGNSSEQQRTQRSAPSEQRQEGQAPQQQQDRTAALPDYQAKLRDRLAKMIELQPPELTEELGGKRKAYLDGLVHLSTWKNHPGTSDIHNFTKKMAEIALQKVEERIAQLESAQSEAQ